MLSHFVKFRRPNFLQAVYRPLHTLLFLVRSLNFLFHGTIALTTYLTVFLDGFRSTIIKYVSFFFTFDNTDFRQWPFTNARSRLSAAFLPDFREFRVDLCLPDFLFLLNLSKPFASRIPVTSALKAAIQKLIEVSVDEEEETSM